MAPVSPASAVPRINARILYWLTLIPKDMAAPSSFLRLARARPNHDFVILRVSRQVSTIKIRRSTRKCIGVIFAPKNVGGVTDIPRDAPKIFMF